MSDTKKRGRNKYLDRFYPIPSILEIPETSGEVKSMKDTKKLIAYLTRISSHWCSEVLLEADNTELVAQKVTQLRDDIDEFLADLEQPR
jgi:hypothetical protein